LLEKCRSILMLLL